MPYTPSPFLNFFFVGQLLMSFTALMIIAADFSFTPGKDIKMALYGCSKTNFLIMRSIAALFSLVEILKRARSFIMYV